MGHVASDRMMQQESASGRGTIQWRPADVFRGDANCEYAVVVLNRPICWKHEVLLPFWQKGMSIEYCVSCDSVARVCSCRRAASKRYDLC